MPWAIPADIPSSPHIPAVLSSHSIYIRLLGTKPVFFSFSSHLGGFYEVGWGRTQPDELIWRSSLTNAFLPHDFHLWGQGFYFIHLCRYKNLQRTSVHPVPAVYLRIISHEGPEYLSSWYLHKLYMFLFRIKCRWPIHFSQKQWFMPQIYVTDVTPCLRPP